MQSHPVLILLLTWSLGQNHLKLIWKDPYHCFHLFLDSPSEICVPGPSAFRTILKYEDILSVLELNRVIILFSWSINEGLLCHLSHFKLFVWCFLLLKKNFKVFFPTSSLCNILVVVLCRQCSFFFILIFFCFLCFRVQFLCKSSSVSNFFS